MGLWFIGLTLKCLKAPCVRNIKGLAGVNLIYMCIMSATFSKNNNREGTACLYPGPRNNSATDSPPMAMPVDSNTLKAGTTQTTAVLGSRTDKTACLFPNSDSGSKRSVSEIVKSSSSSASSGGSVNFVGGVSQQRGKSFVESDSDQQNTAKMSSLCSASGLQVDMPPSKTTECESDEFDIERVPAKALNVPTRTRLSLMLNPPKVLHNDWTGLAGEMGFEYEEIENFAMERDPMKMVLAAWTCKQDSTIGALMQMLREINREDVLNDIQKLVERDASRWVERRKGDIYGQPVQVPEVSGNYPNVPETPELRGITLEDHPSGPPEIFDAYVCFTYADNEFVKEMMSILEKEPYNLKLCIDFRDLVPGGSYSTITAELIENRCKRMIIVLSPDFLTSEDCNFQTKFAHSIAPSARSKRLIPVMVENCKPPNILRHLTICDYTKKDLRQWFWPRLYSALTKK